MKIIITENQLKHVISESYFSIYNHNDIDAFIENDNFKEDHSNDERKFLFIELEKVKNQFKKYLDSSNEEKLTFRNVMKELHLWVNRLKWIRLIIEPEFMITNNKQGNGRIYNILRIFGINPMTGLKERKISKMVGNNINNPNGPEKYTVDYAKKLLVKELWEDYKQTYKI